MSVGASHAPDACRRLLVCTYAAAKSGLVRPQMATALPCSSTATPGPRGELTPCGEMSSLGSHLPLGER